MTDVAKAICTAVAKRSKQQVLVAGKRCLISASDGIGDNEPVRITFTTKVVDEQVIDAKKRLAEMAFDIDAVFKTLFPADKYRAFIGGPDDADGGFLEKEKNGVVHCAMFWGVERRGRWGAY